MISALPIVALMVVAVWMLGVGTLRDLALIQLIGVIEGVISSLFLATSLLVSIVYRKDKYKRHDEEVQAFRSGALDNPDEEAAPAEKRRVHAPVTRTVDDAPVAGHTTWRPNTR